MEDPFPIPLFPILCLHSSQLSHAFADDIAGLEYASPFFCCCFWCLRMNRLKPQLLEDLIRHIFVLPRVSSHSLELDAVQRK